MTMMTEADALADDIDDHHHCQGKGLYVWLLALQQLV